MNDKKHSIIVPFDFTQSAEIALTYAIQIASVVNNDIYLIYFNEDTGFFSSKEKIQKKEQLLYEKLKPETEKLKEKFDYPYNFIIISGKIKTVLSNVIKEKNANLLITGPKYITDEIKIKAIDIINFVKDDNLPVIVTRNFSKNKKIREILVPIEIDKKYKELLRWIIFLAKYYKCNVNFIKPYTSDIGFKQIVENNVFFTRKLLDTNNIIYGIKSTDETESFKDAIINFANSIDADLIIVMSAKFREYVCDKNNSVIESDIIPVMCINERSDLKNYQGFY